MKMPNWLQQRAYLTPQRPALTFEEKTWTFADLYKETCDMAAYFASAGIKQNQLCGVLAGNRPETVFALFALQHIGAAAVMLNSRLTNEEISWQMQDAKVSWLLVDEKHKEKGACFFKTPSCLLPAYKKTKQPGFKPRAWFFLDEICSVMYTSGTTGFPKGVIQTYGNHYESAGASALNLGLQSDDCWLCTMPLFHISGYSIFMKSVIYGMEVYLLEKFDALWANQLLTAGKATMMSVVAAMLNQMVKGLTAPYSDRFRCMLLGGGPAPESLLETCKQQGIPVFQTYGMTETASQIATLAPEDALVKIGSAGKPLFPCAIKIDGEKQGEIFVSGPNVTPGYLNRPDANKESFQDGWFHTGDIGYLDEDGFLYVLDRRSDLIISGGENVYPAEIESVLSAHPAVLEAGVTGVPDSKWGKVPAAFYVKQLDVTAAELKQYCEQKLAAFKVPAYFISVTELPRNAANKLLRRKLAENWSSQNEN